MEKNHAKLYAKDAQICKTLSDTEIFADLFNGSIFHGEQVIVPEQLVACSEKQTLQVKVGNDDLKNLNRIRDVKMQMKSLDERGQPEIILAVEAQREVHYGMPVRSLMYDGVDYSDQMQRKAKYNRGMHSLKTSAELMSGMTEEDRLVPVLTLVLYYGEKKNWIKPADLHDMLDFTGRFRPWKKEFPNYTLHLVSGDSVNTENFKTGLREVFELLKVCHDKVEMNKLLREKNDHYSHLSRERSELLSVFLDIPTLREKPKLFEDEKGDINMCTAIEEMVRDGEKRGMEIGERRGVEIGERRGLVIGEQRGEERCEKRYSQLLKKLLKENRTEDIVRMTEDEEFRKQLFRKGSLLESKTPQQAEGASNLQCSKLQDI
ncbi:MAG TPA: hypothetical protein DIW07_01425 [Lachnospiraceae bacterium]|jgi:hypothetical protein|nr:hypothetical protein [Lachnospiraceae bacterium]HCR82068.1 hypothetical protein [Lachnospiraceae bacterium]